MKKAKIQWGMTIDLDLCIGCQACTIACKQENNIPFVSQEQAKMGRIIQWNELIHTVEGEPPHTRKSLPAQRFVRSVPLTLTLKDWLPKSIPAASAAGSALLPVLIQQGTLTGMNRSGQGK
jgi:ferredoxin